MEIKFADNSLEMMDWNNFKKMLENCVTEEKYLLISIEELDGLTLEHTFVPEECSFDDGIRISGGMFNIHISKDINSIRYSMYSEVYILIAIDGTMYTVEVI